MRRDPPGYAWALYVAAGAAVIAAYPRVPGEGQAVILTLLGAAAALTALVAIIRRKPEARTAWLFLAAGLVSNTIANTLWFLDDGVAVVRAANAFYGIGYALMAGALLAGLKRREPEGFSASVLDGLIVIAGTAILWWALLVQPFLSHESVTSSGRLLTSLYPLSDVVLLAAFAAHVMSPGRSSTTRHLITLGIGMILLSDGLYYWSAVDGAVDMRDALSVGWLLGYVCLGASALHPSMTTQIRHQGPRPTRIAPVRLAGFATTALIGPAALGFGALRGDSASLPVFAVSSVTLVMLVLARMIGLLRNVESKVDELDSQRRALRESEERYRNVVDTVSDVIFQIDTAGCWSFLNPAFERYTGFAVDDVIGTHFLEFVHPDDRGVAMEELVPLISGDIEHARQELRYLAADGGVRWVECFVGAMHDPDGQIVGTAGTLVDVTERKSAEQALAAAERQFRNLVEHIPAVTYVYGQNDESLRYISPRIEELLGFSPEEWTGISFWMDRLHPDDRERVAAENERVNASGDSLSIEYRLVHADGHEVWVHDQAVLVERLGGGSYWQGFLVDITERRHLEEQLTHQAFHDTLTSLSNRALFADRVGHALEQRGRGRTTPLAVLFIDLDDFKTVNDSLGHEAGDRLLQAVAERLKSSVRTCDSVARFGGDEFGVLVEDMERPDDAVLIAERVLEAARLPYRVADQDVTMHMSIGIAITEDRFVTVDELLRNADLAMYMSKRQGGGAYSIFEPTMHAAAVGRLRLKADLSKALDRDELFLLYQPIVDLSSGMVVGAEALVRWQHPERGVVPPLDFIPLAEETGLIEPIGRWVLKSACREAAAWRAADRDPPTITINLSTRQLRNPELVADVATTLHETGIDPTRIVLEITESALMDDVEQTVEMLTRLKDLGVRIAIDDFGTGYSSLSYLQRFPLDILKIDRSFVNELENKAEDSALANAVITLGRSLQLQTIAEGVETEEQRLRLIDLGCPSAQGFYFFRPLEPADFSAALAGRRLVG